MKLGSCDSPFSPDPLGFGVLRSVFIYIPVCCAIRTHVPWCLAVIQHQRNGNSLAFGVLISEWIQARFCMRSLFRCIWTSLTLVQWISYEMCIVYLPFHLQHLCSLHILQKCSEDPLPGILNLVTSLQRSFLDQYKKAEGEEMTKVAEQRFQMATKLFYKSFVSLLDLVSRTDGTGQPIFWRVFVCVCHISINDCYAISGAEWRSIVFEWIEQTPAFAHIPESFDGLCCRGCHGNLLQFLWVHLFPHSQVVRTRLR